MDTISNLWSLLGQLGDVIGFFGSIFAIFAWFKLRALDRLNDEVKIFLTLRGEDQKIELPLSMRRGDVTRAEILGRLGMLPMNEKGKRFSIRYLSNPEFLQALNRVAERKNSSLEIPCSEDEIAQFDI